MTDNIDALQGGMAMSTIPERFIFTDIDAANAEIVRFWRATQISGVAVGRLLEIVPVQDTRANEIVMWLSRELDAISAERDQP